MKKLFILALALCGLSAANAQNDVMTAILQHGDEATSFVGMDALSQAHEAAVDGDMITLSEGSFNSITVTKSVSIYGAGFEKDPEAGTAVSMMKGNFTIGGPDQTLANVRLEGVYVNGQLRIGSNASSSLEGTVITKNYVNGPVSILGTTTITEISRCVINGDINGNNTVATSLQVLNCWLGRFVGFNVSSSVNANHCIVTSDYGGALLYTNCILANYFTTSTAIAEGSVVRNCLCYRGTPPSTNRIIENCYPFANFTDIFTDGDNAGYSPTRTFELKEPETWVGDDGTQVGINGGMGFSKVPATPTVKNLKLNVEGKVLKVDYEAEVR